MIFITSLLIWSSLGLALIGVFLDIYDRPGNNQKWSEWREWPRSLWCMVIACVVFFSTLSVRIWLT